MSANLLFRPPPQSFQRTGIYGQDGGGELSSSKFGAVWTASDDGKAYNHDWDEIPLTSHAEIRFDERPQPYVNKNYTFHVDRGKFDLMLLQHSSELGGECLRRSEGRQ